MLKIRL